MRDALGNPVEIGKCYGYSRNENGFTYVRIGDLVKINEKTVTIKVIVSKRALYSQNLEEDRSSTRDKISIKANMIFPVNREDIKK